MMNINENKDVAILKSSDNGKLWLDLMDSIPCSAFIVKPDSELTFVVGNERFFRQIGITQEELTRKYGKKLGALLTDQSLNIPNFKQDLSSEITLNDENRFDSIEVCIKVKSCEKWIRCDYVSFKAETEIYVFCISFDISKSTEIKIENLQLKAIFEAVTRNKIMDCFEYDFAQDKAKLYSCHAILNMNMADEHGYCNNFSEKFLESGIICDGYEELLKRFWTDKKPKNTKSIIDFKIINQEGSHKWIRLISEPKDTKGSTIFAMFEDISVEQEYMQNYLSETQFYHSMLTDKDAYAHMDATTNKITKVGGMWNLYNELIEKVSYIDIVNGFIEKVVHPDDRKHYKDFMRTANFIESLENGVNRLSCEFRRIVEQNKMVWMKIDVHLFKDPLSNHVVGLAYLKNIDAQKKQMTSLKRIEDMDNLTNVYSRNVLEANIREYLAVARKQEINAFLLIDIENFSKINEIYGYNVGDEILVSLASTLSGIFRKTDLIGRYVSDKFIIFLKNIESKEWVYKRLDELLEALKTKQNLHFIKCNIGISNTVGVVSYERIFRQADLALSIAKKDPDKSYVLYNQEDVDKTLEQNYVNRYTQDTISKVVLNMSELNKSDDINFDSFVSEHGEIAYLVDPDSFDLILGNAAFYSRMGVTEEQCIGKTCYEILHKRDSPCPFCSKVNWTTDKFYVWKNMNYVLEQEFLIKNKLVTWHGKEVMLALSIDISNNKSIVDSIESTIGDGGILGAVQHMDEADTTNDVIESALEDIGAYFRAKSVQFWKISSSGNGYVCSKTWHRKGAKYSEGGVECNIDSWIASQKWDHQVIIENQEAMLYHSFDVYKYMLKTGIHNQRWAKVSTKNEDYGYICVNDLTANLQNISFLESFLVFFAGELRNRKLIEGAVYADNHDSLTNLLSRHSYETLMMEYNKDLAQSVGVLIANFNDLKSINSDVGIQEGNNYIKNFASRLRNIFQGDKIYRLNGDEFLVISFDSSLESLESKVATLHLELQENSYYTVSIGYSWDNIEKDIAVLVDESTKTMKVNKKRFYDENNKSDGSDRRKMLNELINAIENKRYEVFLQAKIDMQANKLIGAEALVRYRDKRMGIVAPANFIETLEKHALVRYVDLFVFEQVCALIRKWLDEGKIIPIISVNFSRITIQEIDISDIMNNIVNQYNVPKEYIEIEITESAASMGKSMLYRAARAIRKNGFAISLDDFGTKYTNLAIIADIDFDVLKLDKSLVDKLENQFKYQAIAKNIIEMCINMGIKVIAEGVETDAQAQKLMELGCKYCQGYLYSKPIEISEFEEKYKKDLEN